MTSLSDIPGESLTKTAAKGHGDRYDDTTCPAVVAKTPFCHQRDCSHDTQRVGSRRVFPQPNEPINIGGACFSGRLFLAPMAGVGDLAFRHLCREYGAAYSCTEMISAKGLLYGNAQTLKLLELSPLEKPAVVQLFGSDPDIMREAALHPALKAFDVIDVNMGCPAPKITGSGEGSALMREPQKAERIIKALAATGRTVTVKFRAGWDGASVNCVEFARMAEGAGVAAVALHPRTREMQYGGEADYALTEKAAAAVKIPLIHSGDIRGAEDITRAGNAGAAAFMVGRASLGRPYIFRELAGGERERDIYTLICRHINMLKCTMEEKFLTPYMRAHIGHYVRGIPGAAKVREKVNRLNDLSAVLSELEGFFNASAANDD